ncbi:unnamed protein product [Commensalibacter communis]|uniref:Spy/CpxP family protein refolding chaperone n=2 Tax=Commensalibacter communis TaxID=2972786 RepID=A0A9W4TLR2_9PROT|nr:unnamed protein product [Commensalibacter communis]CAI3926144.1 unnamed protein product [Commensalibacter communis]CAI3935218.1 unnamed protein product [Commensalibacter communis]CAI3936866.1 unnamed protein product [Commensalibacter communis]
METQNIMKMITRKLILSLGICAGLLTAGMSASHVHAQPVGGNMASAMAAFDKLTPEQQKEQLVQSKKMIEARMDQMIKQASTPEQKQQLEAAKTKALEQVDAMAKMTPEERKALVAKAQENVNQQINKLTPEQLKQLTPEQRAALEKYKATQGSK